MVDVAFRNVYDKIKLQFYRNVFDKIQNRELTLTTVETFCIEIIYAMDRPTIGEFASYVHISSPNAAYKVNSLIKKGYLRKIQSEDDKREYYLEVTEKYMSYCNISNTYMKTVMDRVEDRFNKEELEVLKRVFKITAEELMPELEEIDEN